MKFVLRVIGTWFLGLALILVIIDGVKTLATNTIVVTSLATTWGELHAASWASASAAIAALFERSPAGPDAAQYLFSLPAWIVFILFGVVFLLLGRQRASKSYIATY